MTDGLLSVDKPAGMTSHDVVARCRRVFGQRRVGHAGTLDPDATGVLLVGLGQATRLLSLFSGFAKTYECLVVLGSSTTTLDGAGETIGTWDMGAVTVEAARRAAQGLTGDIEQIPPMVSAVKVGGRRLHELARQGVEVERKPRPVHVESFELWELDDLGQRGSRYRGESGAPVGSRLLGARVVCSSGTYVRTLVADLGTLLGGGAHLRMLRRTAIGPWAVEAAIALDAVGPDAVESPAAALSWLGPVVADSDLAVDVGHGKVLTPERLGVAGPGPWPVVSAAGDLLAVYQRHTGGTVKPMVVLVQ